MTASIETEAAHHAASAERLRAAIAPFEAAASIFTPTGEFIEGLTGECLCGFITGEDLIGLIGAVKAGSARIQDLGTEGHAYREGKLAGQNLAAADRDLVIDHLGDLLAREAARANVAEAELIAARSEIERQREYIAGRDYEC